MRKRSALSVGIVFLLLPAAVMARAPRAPFVGALSSLDDGFGASAAWAGIWNLDIVLVDCASEEPLFSYSITDTICTGDPVMPSDLGVGVICSGTVNDTQIEVDCSWTAEAIPGCVQSFAMSTRGTLSQNAYTMISTLNVTSAGDSCESIQDSCTRTDVTAVRIGPQPPSCGSPVEASTWGRVKALYR